MRLNRVCRYSRDTIVYRIIYRVRILLYLFIYYYLHNALIVCGSFIFEHRTAAGFELIFAPILFIIITIIYSVHRLTRVY